MNTDIKIFVSYRRADSTCFAERVRDWFMLSYKRENVFMDFDAIPPFVDFEVFIIEQIQKVDVMLVIIGPRWLELLQERANTGNVDYVRLEISKALAMGKLVAPILVDGASTPSTDALPDDIRGMMRANIPRLDGGRQFLDNIERIVGALPQAIAQHVRIQSATEAEAEGMADPLSAAMPFFPPALEVAESAEADEQEEAVARRKEADDYVGSSYPPPAAPSAAPPPQSSPAPARAPQRGRGQQQSQREETPPPPKPRVGLFAVTQDEEILRHIKQDVEALGVEVLINPVAENIKLAIVALSPEGRHSDWMHGEIGLMHAHEIPVLPVLAAGDVNSSLPYSVSANQMVDLRDYAAGRDNLVQAVQMFI